jgi:aspartate ammonia-lyase
MVNKKAEEMNMPKKKQKFMTSPFFVDEPGNWHLKDGAPKELKEEFEAYMEKVENDDNLPASVEGVRISYPYDS